MKAVILAYCKQRQILMVYYFGLVVSEKRTQAATHMASMASLAIKWMRDVLAARRHYDTNTRCERKARTPAAAVVQISAASLPKPPAAAFPDPPKAPEAKPTAEDNNGSIKTRR